MADEHVLTFKVHPRSSTEWRHRWTIYEDGLARYHSPESYATRREADLAGDKAMKKLIDLESRQMTDGGRPFAATAAQGPSRDDRA